MVRQLSWLRFAGLSSYKLIVVTAAGALSAGLAAIGTPGAASNEASSAPAIAAAAAFYARSSPVGQSTGLTRVSSAPGTAPARTLRRAAPAGPASLLAAKQAVETRAAAQRAAAAAARAAAQRAAAAKRAAQARAKAALAAAQADARRQDARRQAAQRSAAQESAVPQRTARAGLLRTTAGSASSAARSGTPRGIAVQLLAAQGWRGQFSCLDALWVHESGWRVDAENPSSGAYGIPQALPAAQMASAGADWRTSAATQIRWGLSYISSRYGSPCAAWSHEESAGWY